ncbi:MAG: SBBP repeat-containing protein [Promethearchaeia archaeon]
MAQERKIIILKYNPNGTLLWNQTWGGQKNDIANAITIDDQRNIYITGYTESFNPNGYDFLIIKYNKDGIQIWNQTFGGIYDDFGMDISFYNNTNIYLIGNSINNNSGNCNIDIEIIKINNNGTILWNKSYGSLNNESCSQLTIDLESNIYISGVLTNLNSDNQVLFIKKYNRNGSEIWNQTFELIKPQDKNCIDIDNNGNIFVSGFYNINYFLLKYQNNGTKLKEIWCYEDYYAKINGITIDNTNAIYIAGFYHYILRY